MTVERSGSRNLTDEARRRLVALRRGTGTALPAIIRAGRDAGPLSYAQQRMWFLHEFVPAAEAYTIAGALRVVGDFSVEAFRWALTRVVERHEALRSTFHTVDGDVVQRVGPATVEVVEVEGGDVDHWAGVELAMPFDLTSGSLVRARIVHTGGDERFVVVALDHIAGDGWSMGVLIREVAAHYAEFVTGAPAGLPELAVQYLDFALWQRETLTGRRLDGLLGHWRDALDGAPPVLDLTGDRLRPAMQSFRGSTVRRVLGGPDGRARATEVDEFARKLGATPFMVLLSAFGSLVSRWADTDDVLLATPMANRSRAEIEPLVGFFVNTLIMRVRTAGDPSFGELVERVRQVALDAFAHQDLPFEKLVEDLAPERDLSRNPVAQVMFILQNASTDELSLPGCEVTRVAVESTTSKFDLTLALTPTANGYEAEWEYATDLFDRRTVESMADAFDLLLAAALAEPDERVAGIPLATARQWDEGPRRDFDAGTTVELIARQVAARPDAIAVRSGGTTLSYRELWDRAGAVAARLRDRGVGPDVPVGVAMRRGPALLPALLGVWLAGGAYLPLDPDDPPERLGYILGDAAGVGLTTVLVDEDVTPPVPDGAAWSALPLTLPLEASPAFALSPGAAPESLAYIIYTSGSTGRPKGVLIEHRSLVNRLVWMQEEYGLAPEHRVYQKTNHTFDVSLWELFWPLTAGATVVLATPGVQREPVEMAAEMARERVTHTHFVPTALSTLLSVASLRDVPLELLVCSGEALPAELVRQVGDDCGLPVRNLYGPTEAAVDVSHITCTAGSVPEGTRTPIGHPVANTDLHVLDGHLNPVPDGMPGELYIGGVQLARGYLGNPALTAERFIKHPATGARLYRTGDRARRRHDGALEYLGRTDDQVKVHGYRIELGEIEAALREHLAVRDSAVVADLADGGGRLLGYVTPDLGAVAESLASDQVDQWREVFDGVYATDATTGSDPGTGPADLDIRGWQSSYTGEELSAGEMREWADDIVGLIRSRRPARVLEIGCGTGLLLFRLAPDLERFTGLDVSRPVLDLVRARLGPLADTVDLIPGSAEDIAAPRFADRLLARPDCVVINSVAQYFPSADYLTTVLDAAAELVEPGGTIIVGDVRDLGLHASLSRSVELFRDPGLDEETLAARVARRLEQEEELVLAPEFFLAWAAARHLPVDVWLTPKRMTADNELSRYRYDVVLTVAPRGAAPRADRQLDYADLGSDPERLRAVLAGTGAVAVAGIPNARLTTAPGALTVPEILAAAPGAHVTYDLTRPDHDHLVVHRTAEPGALPAVTAAVDGSVALANSPLLATAARSLPSQLRAHLERLLPAHMVPAITVLAEFPLTSSGKTDRKRLPRPDEARALSSATYVAPRSDTERAFALVWQDVLGVRGIGALDRFFQVGGDSIRAVQVVARLVPAGYDLQVSDMFEHQTLEAIAALADARAAGPRPTALEAVDLRTAADRTAGVAGVYPLAPLQEHMHGFGAGAPGLFTMQRVLRFSGPLDPDAARRAWIATVRAHGLLHTSLDERDGVPVQVVHGGVDEAAAAGSLVYEDWSGVPAAEREARTRAALAADLSLGFDAAVPVPMRHRIIRLTDDAGIWLLSCDYRRLDGWSFSLCMGHFLDAYADVVQRGEAAPPASDFDYGLFAAWLARERANPEHAEWWHRQLGGTTVRNALSAGSAAEWTHSPFRVLGAGVPGEVGRGLAATARRLDVTVASLFQSAWALALLRTSGHPEVTFGVTAAGRPPQLPGVEGAVGVFMNTVPAVVGYVPSERLGDWLRERGRWFAQLAGHDFPTPGEIARWTGLPENAALFDSYFVFQNTPRHRASTAADDLVINDRPLIIMARQEHAVRIDIYPYPDGVYEVLQSGYESAVDADTQARLLRDFVCCLRELSTDDRGQTVQAVLARAFDHEVGISSAESRLQHILEEQP
ncbi:amino acid adenylation domain-containing protein [Streptomyces sp. B6B3]|uniref:non-ribosomal peptide synthetase n=1 Tax=Streptomyces sp. B6B3 TaxID=3153570 RepID=UPI00325C6C2A